MGHGAVHHQATLEPATITPIRKLGENLRVSPAMALTCAPLRSLPNVLRLKSLPRTSIQASQSCDGAAGGGAWNFVFLFPCFEVPLTIFSGWKTGIVPGSVEIGGAALLALSR